MMIILTAVICVIMMIQHAYYAVGVIIYLMKNVIPAPLDVMDVIVTVIVTVVTVDIIILILIVIHVKAHVIHV